jgi:hypothetical protein
MRRNLAQLACPHCKRGLQFEARVCGGCDQAVAFDPDAGAFRFLETAVGCWAGEDDHRFDASLCDNSRYGVCNWLVGDGDARGLCRSCRHNRIIPDLSVPGVLGRWRTTEDAKRRALWGVMRLGLTLDGHPPLAFHLLYDPFAEAGGAPTLPTGYFEGLITLNIIEADDAARERIRMQMGEAYRTLVGHFRHELGHHYFRLLVAFTSHIEAFRRLFGDETAHYGTAAQRYYAFGADADWCLRHVSPYASMHPLEDFAETFSHYLHIVDTLATIGDFDLRMPGEAVAGVDPYRADTATLTRLWTPYAQALNAVNRSMGQPDLYPFELTPVGRRWGTGSARDWRLCWPL